MDEPTKAEFLESFKITNNLSDKVSVYCIRKWCKERYIVCKTTIYPWLDELNCKPIKFNGTAYRTGIKLLPSKQEADKIMYESCRICHEDIIINPIVVPGGYACKKCKNQSRSLKPNIIVCPCCDDLCGEDTEKTLYKTNQLDNMRIKYIRCSKCSPNELNRFARPGIYILYCKDISVKEEYVGQSRNMIDRIVSHKSCVGDKTKSVKLYNFIRDHGGYENWEFNILEVIPSNIPSNRISTWLNEKEQWWIDRLEPKLNSALKNNPYATSFLSYTGEELCETN